MKLATTAQNTKRILIGINRGATMDNGSAAILIALGTLLGGGGTVFLTKIVEAYIRLRNNSASTDKTVRVDALIEYKALLDRQEKKVLALEHEMQELRKDYAASNHAHAECQRDHARALDRIGYLEDALTNAGIPFQKRNSTGDTGRHPKPEDRTQGS